MYRYQKIYFNNKPLVLTNSASNYVNEYPASAGYLLLRGAFVRNLRLAKSHLKNIGGLGVLLEDIDWEVFQNLLDDFFVPITAAGGVVSTPDNKTLMIFRRGKWDLPKGKLDEGELISECARREVMEETGLPDEISLGEEICKTYHVYPHDAKDALKITHWYQMNVTKEWPLFPQKEENILEAEWVSENNLPVHLRKAWNAVTEVLTQAGKKVK